MKAQAMIKLPGRLEGCSVRVAMGMWRRWMALQWARLRASPEFDERIPSPAFNYNSPHHWWLRDYLRSFKYEPCLLQLPFLMERAGCSSRDFALFDYGCGLGRLSYAFSQYFHHDGAYLGFEVHPKALDFLRRAYGEFPNMEFIGQALVLEDSYVEQMQVNRTEMPRRVAEDVSFANGLGQAFHAQWSGSVFTHMRREPIVAALRGFLEVLASGGVMVNTWFIVDEFAQYAMRCGLADRQLPYEVEGYLTYDRDIPLVCSAYRLEDVEAIYAEAGHEIEEILFGSWAGRDNGVIYQDIVVSRRAT